MFLLSLVFACATNERVDGILALDGDVGAGEAIYDQHCEGCHGTDGEGVDGHPTLAGEMHHSDAMILTWILDGKGYEMPSFGADLDDQDAADLMASCGIWRRAEPGTGRGREFLTVDPTRRH